MIEILGLVASVAVPVLGGLVWLIRLEGKLNTERALREALEHRLSGFEQRIYSALERIENKLDSKMDKE